jgi:hypothetical protein
MLETNAALAFGGLTLGVTRDRGWLMGPGIALPFLLHHTLQGWCPPIEVIRRGVCARREINRERVALRALRGDFGLVASDSTPQERAILALSPAEG